MSFWILLGFPPLLFYFYCKWTYQYWDKKKIPYLKPQLPFGNIPESVKKNEHIGVTIKRMYDELKRRKLKHGGVYFFLTPNYFLINLDYVRNIMTKDFDTFVDRPLYCDEEIEPISGHLVNLKGERWKNLRVKMTPTFTTAKMKRMFVTMMECVGNLEQVVESKCQKNEAVDFQDILQSFGIDVICSCAFGLDTKVIEDENSPFRVCAKKIFKITRIQQLKNIFSTSFPKLAKIFKMKVLPQDVSDFFMRTITDVIKQREKFSQTRNDFLQLMLNTRQNGNVEESLTDEEIAAQCALFFAAGFETISTTMTCALYELAKNQTLQDRAREEICTVLDKHDGKITYESLEEMKYLKQVVDETLRKYSPVPYVRRQCVKDYKIPDEDIVIEKDTIVIISIYGIHHDEEYYPEPEKFDPERFNEENKKSRHNYAHLPFGEGPRNCIGKRFAFVQSQSALIMLLKNYKFTLHGAIKEPFAIELNSFVFSYSEKIRLNVKKIGF